MILYVVPAVVVLAVAALLIAAARQPDEFTVERSTLVEAAPAIVFPFINEFRQWIAWSPWEGLDPALKRTYEGPAGGVGTSYAWEGNRQVGAGRMAIERSVPGEAVGIRLEFLRPFPATNRVDFTLVPEAGGTRVHWRMVGQRNFIMKVMGTFFSMDKMLGGTFEQGLASLKSVSERGASAPVAAGRN
ncbi:MAG TPA: SRPBCC family protein [Opitutaceae bacterium]|nr:SRPBCC family protein [Opitutaceae bacterium]